MITEKRISISMLILLAVILFSCDVIDPPYGKGYEPPPPIDSNYTKLLFEEYTGSQCPNCPEGAEEAHLLKEMYGDNMIIVSIHAGMFAIPSKKDPDFAYDFRTPMGDSIVKEYSLNTKGYPSASLNRITYSTSKVVEWNNWQAYVSSLMGQKTIAPVKIKLVSTYNSETRKIDVNVDLEYLENASNGNTISVWLLEDGIVKPQKDKNVESGVIKNYIHNNVLRYSFNGIQGNSKEGDIISATNIEKNAKFDKKYSYIIPENSDWIPNNLKVVAFVYDNAENGRVLQSELVQVK